MAELDRALVRKLAEWTPGEYQVTSMYLSVDGKLYPRTNDYEVRLDELLRSVKEAAHDRPKPERLSIEKDAEVIRTFVIDNFERGNTRGLALFSSSGSGLWEEIELSRPVRNQAIVAPHPDVLQLDAILEMYESFCTVVVDGEKARIFLSELGRIEEESDLFDDVPGRHDQGGWSQGRYQRHIDEHRQRHFKHTAEVLFGYFKRRSFDHLIIAGPEELLPELEHELHDYLKQRIVARISLPITASASDVLERSLHIEEELDRERVRQAVEQVVAESAAGRQAIAGLEPTLEALELNRVGTLVVAMDLRAPGRECPTCGRLTLKGKRCPTCGADTREVPDVVEAAVAQAHRHGCRVETASKDEAFEKLGGIGALLRF